MKFFAQASTFVVCVALLFGLSACDDSTGPDAPTPGSFEAQAEVNGETFNFSANAFFAAGEDLESDEAGMGVIFTTLDTCAPDEDEMISPPYAVLVREDVRPGTGTYPLGSAEEEEIGDEFVFFWIDGATPATSSVISSESGTVTVETSSVDTFAGSVEGEVQVITAGTGETETGTLSVSFEATACPDLFIPQPGM